MTATLEQLVPGWRQAWEIPPQRTLSEWAEENWVLSPEYSAATGPLRLRGWQRPIFDSFTDPRVKHIVLKTSTQVVKTLFIQVVIGYTVACQPGPILVAMPKEDDAMGFSKERLGPMFRDIPALRGKVGDPSKKDAGSTILYKEFPGGVLTVVGAGAPGNAARKSIMIACFDEVNKYPVTKEGDFVSLAEERLATFGSRAKRIETCSPTTPDGRISIAYERSDQCQPWLPCHRCGFHQVLKFSTHVVWDKSLPDGQRAASAVIRCQNCAADWNDNQRWRAAEVAEMRPQRPFHGIRGYGDISHLISPYKTLAQVVQKFLDCKANPSELRVFINTNLAEDYVEKGDAPEWRRLYERSRNEPHKLGVVPRGGLFLTCGIDVQNDRLEAQVKAWGRGRQSWVVDYVVLDGNPSESHVWPRLDDLLARFYPNEDGLMLGIACAAIDTGAFTQDVYHWVRQQGPTSRVIAIKGAHSGHLSILGTPSAQDVNWRGQRIKNGVQVRSVGVGEAKKELYRWLALPTPTEKELADGGSFPAGYCHLSSHLGEEFFEQLTAEQIVTHTVRGYATYEWQKTRERNEALDTAVYARAAAAHVGLDRFQDQDWATLEAMLSAPPAPAMPAPKQRDPQAGKWFGDRKGWL